MGALAKTDVTLSAVRMYHKGPKRVTLGTLSVAGASKTYPDNGIPLPDIADFGFRRNLDVLTLTNQNCSPEARPAAPAITPSATTGNITTGDHYYKVTFVTAAGESAASAYSVVFTAVATGGSEVQKCTVTRPTGYSSAVTHWNVYRTEAAGNPDSDHFHLVNASPIAIGTGTYLDNVADGSLQSATAPDRNGTNFTYHARYDKTNHKLLLFEEEGTAAGGPLLECDTSEVPGPRTWNFEAIGW